MDSNIFSIGEVMLMLDVMREDKIRWLKIGVDKDVTGAYDSIISKLEIRIKEYNGIYNAINSLIAIEKSD